MSNSTHSTDTFTLLYFAFLQEKAGKPEEKRRLTPSLTAKALFDSVCDELGLDAKETPVRVSINHAFADWDSFIQANDIVAFIPPVAGG